MTRSIFPIIALIVLLAACTQQPITPRPTSVHTTETFDPQVDVTVSTFNSAEELKAFVQGSGGGNYYLQRGMEVMEMAMDSAAEAGVPMAKSADFSETNVQVTGVDEADIVKTDGKYIYTISGTTLFIVQAYPGEDAEVISEIEFENRPQGLFVDGDRLAVFGNFNDLDYFKKYDLRPRYGMTYFDVYDISDKKDPEQVDTYKFEGNYFQARMTDGWVYFIVRSGPEYRPMPMPIILENDVLRHVPISDVYYYNLPYENVEFATVHAIDMDAGELSSKTVAVEGSQNLYMSYENIYITYTERINEWELRQDIMMQLLENEITPGDRELIEKIENADGEVLSKREKRQKIIQIYQGYVNYMDRENQDELQDRIEEDLKELMASYESLEFTVINKIEVDDGRIKVGSSGKVPGQVNNQFSLDEYEGVLRIATTVSPQRWWGGIRPMIAEDVADGAPVADMIAPPRPTESTNNIYTLDEDLDVLDKLEGLAEGERIFSARFMGPRLYMVTFRQIDPFFVIDLSNPRNIKELGELKIPGFSRYLHPYDENTIIGLGRDATSTGRQQGLKISLFDVSDVSEPEEIAKWISNERYSQSSAEFEHKAFLFSKEKNLLVIPAYSYDYDDGQSYNGALVFRITDDEIKVRGIIDHAKEERRYGPTVLRSLYIEELLYTLSEGLLRINDLEDLHGVKDVSLDGKDRGPYPVY